METLIIAVICLVIGFGGYFFSKNPDGPVEQAAEKVLKDSTGLDVDFSPDTDNDKEDE